MIDTHTHLYERAFDNDRDLMLDRARRAGVTHMVIPATSAADRHAVSDLCDQHPDTCLPLFGLHPTEMGPDPLAEAADMLSYGDQHHTRGVGEVGLDLHWDKTRLPEQLQALELQLRHAAQRHLPASIHCREALNQLVELLQQLGADVPDAALHCYAGSREQALDIAARWPQIYFGFGGSTTYKNSHLAQTAAALPRDRILLETDAPYLTPAPHRGQRNEPAYLTHVRDQIAQALQTTPQDVDRITSDNARRLFRIH